MTIGQLRETLDMYEGMFVENHEVKILFDFQQLPVDDIYMDMDGDNLVIKANDKEHRF